MDFEGLLDGAILDVGCGYGPIGIYASFITKKEVCNAGLFLYVSVVGLLSEQLHNLVVNSLAIVTKLLVKHLVWSRVTEVVKAVDILH